MKSINIKGRPYVMVNERLSAFRKDKPDWSLESEIVMLDSDSVTIKAIIKDEQGRIRATGLANEEKASSMINKTSYIENAETSAWGRALGNLGYGIEDSIASAEEVDMAIKKQEKKITHEQKDLLEEYGVDFDKVISYYKLKDIMELDFVTAQTIINKKIREKLLINNDGEEEV
jgi:hypothetical protein